MKPAAPIGVSMGDPAGIGPEIILKAWSQRRSASPVFFAIGDHRAFAPAAALLDLPPPVAITRADQATGVIDNALPVLQSAVPLAADIRPGDPHSANAAATRAAIEDGVALCLQGEASALVTAPISKSVMYADGFAFPGHTEFLAELTRGVGLDGPRGPVMMLSGGGLRVALTSIHEPIAKAVTQLDAARIEHVVRVVHAALHQDFGLAHPRLAMAGLNPHAGESGSLGEEEQRVINPLVDRLRTDGIDVTQALPPDTMFHAEARAGYDAAICHYHDQGLIPVKTLDFHGGVNITLGLPIVRTSPDHGTAFNIAGRGAARADSMIAAIGQAAAIAGHRA